LTTLQRYLCRQQYHDTKLWVTTACRSPEMGAHSNLVSWLTVNQQHNSRQQTNTRAACYSVDSCSTDRCPIYRSGNNRRILNNACIDKLVQCMNELSVHSLYIYIYIYYFLQKFINCIRLLSICANFACYNALCHCFLNEFYFNVSQVVSPSSQSCRSS